MNNSPQSADRDFEARASKAFDASVARLDGAGRSRLNQARQLAVAEARRPAFRLPGLWIPAGALATVAALGVVAFLVTPFTPHRAAVPAAVEEVDLLSANEGIDLYAEDPEFFEWAGNGETAAPAAQAPDRG